MEDSNRIFDLWSVATVVPDPIGALPATPPGFWRGRSTPGEQGSAPESSWGVARAVGNWLQLERDDGGTHRNR